MINPKEFKKIIQYGIDYTTEKFRKVYGNVWTLENGETLKLEVRDTLYSRGIVCEGYIIYPLFERECVCQIEASYEEIIASYYNTRDEYRNLLEIKHSCGQTIRFWEAVKTGKPGKLGLAKKELGRWIYPGDEWLNTYKQKVEDISKRLKDIKKNVDVTEIEDAFNV